MASFKLLFPHDFAAQTTGLGAYRNNILVGVASAYHVPLPDEYFAWQLRAMATIPWVRGFAYGRRLLDSEVVVIYRLEVSAKHNSVSVLKFV